MLGADFPEVLKKHRGWRLNIYFYTSRATGVLDAQLLLGQNKDFSIVTR